MPGRADETAYCLNGKLQRLALIGKGVRFPGGGAWIRVAGSKQAPWEGEPLVFEDCPKTRTIAAPVDFIPGGRR